MNRSFLPRALMMAAAYMALALTMSRNARAAEICEFSMIGCPESFQGNTIIVPTKVNAMSADVYICQPTWIIEAAVASGKPPSIMFVIDNSGSMRRPSSGEPAHDPEGNRYKVTIALLDSLWKYKKDAEVGVAVFSNVLYFDPTSPQYFSRYVQRLPVVTDNVPNQGYIQLLRLDSLYVDPTNPAGRYGIDIIKDALATRVVDANPDYVDLVYRPQSFTPSNYTNINVGFDAARAAMTRAANPKENQFVIFLSDGEPQGDMQAGRPANDFVNGTNMPTTFTVFFTSNAAGPANIQQMTQNIRINNYSTSNPRSDVWTMESQYDNLLNLLMNSVLKTILTLTKASPADLVINNIRPVSSSDSIFVFGNKFPLTQDSTYFRFEILYHVIDQNTKRAFDSLITVSFNVKRSDALPASKNIAIECVEHKPYTVTLSATTPNAMENGASGRYTFRRDSTVGALTVYYSIVGTAVNGGDYRQIADSIVFANGQAEVTLDIVPLVDNIAENSETVQLALQSARTGRTINYNVGVPSGGTVTIVDFTVFASVTTDIATVSEANGRANFIIARNDTAGECIVYFTLTGNAIMGTDYLSVPDSVVIPRGQKTATVTIIGIPDAITENNESVTLNILGAKAGRSLKYTVGSPPNASILFTDYRVFLTVSAPVATMSENGGVGRFVIRRNDAAEALTVYFTLSGSATQGSDYRAIADSIVMPAGKLADTVSITAIQDFVQEIDETVVLTLDQSRPGRTVEYGVGMPGDAGIIIIDYTSLVTVTATTRTISENGGAGSFIIRRSNASGQSVIYFRFAGTATAAEDYATPPDSVIIASGYMTATVNITAIRDYIPEGSESIVLVLETSRQGRTIEYSLGTPGSDSIMITNFASLATISAREVMISENGGSANFTVKRTDSTGACTIYLTLGGTAAVGVDYQAIPDSVVLADGKSSAVVTVTAIRDFEAEANETVIIAIDGARQGRTLRYEVGAPSSDTVAIQEYTVMVSLKGPAAAISEKGATGNFVFKRSDAVGDMTVYFTVTGTAALGADYPPIADSVVFANGQDSAHVVITGIWDYIKEPDETVIIAIDASRAGRTIRYAVGAPAADTAIIADFTVYVTAKASPSSMSENGDTARFVIRRNDATGLCTVYFTIGGTATPDSDYVAIADSIVLADGQLTADVLIVGIRDYSIEKDETVIITIADFREGRTLRYSAGVPASATIRIRNYVEPFSVVPHTLNNPYQIGRSPVPEWIRALPNMNGAPVDGVVIAASATPRIREEVTLSGTLSIYDVVKNPIVEDLTMVFDKRTKSLYYVWDGRNSNGRNVAAGTYMAIIKITDNLKKTVTKRTPIGVKR